MWVCWLPAEGAQALASDLANASEANQAACESVVTEAGKLSGEVERALDAVVAFKAKVSFALMHCVAAYLVFCLQVQKNCSSVAVCSVR